MDWITDSFLPRAAAWPALGPTQIVELRAALQLLHTQAIFASESVSGSQIQGWNHGLQQLARAPSADVRWSAACLAGAAARASSAPTFVTHGAAWVAFLLPLLKSNEPNFVHRCARPPIAGALSCRAPSVGSLGAHF